MREIKCDKCEKELDHEDKIATIVKHVSCNLSATQRVFEFCEECSDHLRKYTKEIVHARYMPGGV
jgi:uncharacterized protein with PIN domain